MRLEKLTMLSAAALLAGGMGMALAQSGSTTSPSMNQNKCWDEATNQIKDKMASNTTGSTSSSGSAGATTGTTGSGSTMGSGTSSSTTGSGTGSSAATTRPPEAAGLPNC